MEKLFSNYGDEIFYATYFLLGISAVSAILLPLIKSISDPRSLIKVGSGLVGLIIIYFICISTAGGDMSFTSKEFDESFSSNTLKNIGAMLRVTYVLVIIAVVGAVATEVLKIKIFK